MRKSWVAPEEMKKPGDGAVSREMKGRCRD